MSPSDVWLVIDGHDERQKVEWERARMGWWMVHIHTDVKKPAKSPQRLISFPWEEGAKIERNNNPMDIKMKYLEALSKSTGIDIETLKKEKGIK